MPKPTKDDVNTCAGCPKLCRHSCPVAESLKIEAYTPTAKQTTIKMLDDGRIPLSVDALQAAYYCTLCGSHTDHCKPQIDGRGAIMRARMTAYDEGLIPDRLRAALAKYRETGSLFDPAGSRIGAPFAREADAYVLVDPLDKDDVFAAERYLALLAKLGERVGVTLVSGLASGPLLFELGLRDESLKIHERVVRQSSGEGLKLVTNPQALAWLLGDGVYRLMTSDAIRREKPDTMKLKGHRSPYLAASDYLWNLLKYAVEDFDYERIALLDLNQKSKIKNQKSITPGLSSYIFGGALSVVDPSAEDAMACKLLADASYFGIETIVTSSVRALRKLSKRSEKPRIVFVTEFLNRE
ncbi:MAG: hypothetical protein NUW37_05360 [Planctomycetes bacterium]|nr:hypothetical protein [Planctomycetota bacterium]